MLIKVLNFPAFWERDYNKCGIIFHYYFILLKINNIPPRCYM